MKKAQLRLLTLSLMLVLIALIVGNCGGGDDTGAVPNVSGNPGQVQTLINKEVSGYIFWAGSIPSPEGGNTERFVVLDNPLTGEENFLFELSSYLQEENPDAWASSEVQSIYTQLSSEMAGWKPLKEWNANANLYTIYQDSKQTSPLQVDTNGYFSGTVLVSSADNNVRFEVIVGDNEKCYSVEAMSSTEINTSEANATELASCPEIILNFPGLCTIFEVRSKPDAINLKDAGLTFTLNDANLGCVSPPVYLKCGGKRNYEVAYGIFYANPGISTPASTTITAQITTGLTLNIFTEVIGSCASIEGHVGGTGVIPVAGFVYSAGWDSFDCIDEAGNYKLNAVFKGHFREVVAVYWVQVNGQLVKHREERMIDFFNRNLTGFDLPTASFPPPTDTYYDYISGKIINQKVVWQEELGWEGGRQKTIDWLNGLIQEEPLPADIAEAIRGAEMDKLDPRTIWIYFKSGLDIYIEDPIPILTDEDMLPNGRGFAQPFNKTIVTTSAEPISLKNSDVLLLGPAAYENKWNRIDLFNGLESDFSNKLFNVTNKSLMNYQVNNLNYPRIQTPCRVYDTLNNPTDNTAQVEFTGPTYQEDEFKHLVFCNLRYSPSSYKNTFPKDFENMNNYGVIFIETHGSGGAMMACPYYHNSEDLDEWLDRTDLTEWCYGHVYFSPVYDYAGSPTPSDALYLKIVALKKEFFTELSQDFEGSLIYTNMCWGKFYNFGYEFIITPTGEEILVMDYYDKRTFKNSQVVITPTFQHGFRVDGVYAYNFFRYMLGIDPLGNKITKMSALDAYHEAIGYPIIGGTQIYPLEGDGDNIFMPIRETTVGVLKKE